MVLGCADFSMCAGRTPGLMARSPHAMDSSMMSTVKPSTSRCRAGGGRVASPDWVAAEVGYGTGGREVAAELAEHFVRGRDAARAVQYLRYAGEQAVQRLAHQEALPHLTRALELLAMLPETRRGSQQELDLQITLELVTAKAIRLEMGDARSTAIIAEQGSTTTVRPDPGGLPHGCGPGVTCS